MYKRFFCIAILALLVSCDNNPAGAGSAEPCKPSESCITDSRDGKRYRTVEIGNHVWMADNLNYNSKGSMCYGNNSANCSKYGRLYTWASAMGLDEKFNTTWTNIGYNNPNVHYQGACPEGWRIPNVNDSISFLSAIGDNATAGTKLKAKSGWNDNGNGTDEFGFAAMPGGGYNYNNNEFWGIGKNMFWWINQNDGSFASFFGLSHASESIGNDRDRKLYAFSVRCVRDKI